jgi:adenylate kinase family enzyme
MFVSAIFAVPAISTGDIIRKEIKNGSALGEQVKAFSNAGKLVPDEIVTAMVKSRLAEPDAKWGFILDGYPRTIRQAEDLDAFAVGCFRGRGGANVSRTVPPCPFPALSADNQPRAEHFPTRARAHGEE